MSLAFLDAKRYDVGFLRQVFGEPEIANAAKFYNTTERTVSRWLERGVDEPTFDRICCRLGLIPGLTVAVEQYRDVPEDWVQASDTMWDQDVLPGMSLATTTAPEHTVYCHTCGKHHDAEHHPWEWYCEACERWFHDHDDGRACPRCGLAGTGVTPPFEEGGW